MAYFSDARGKDFISSKRTRGFPSSAFRIYQVAFLRENRPPPRTDRLETAGLRSAFRVNVPDVSCAAAYGPTLARVIPNAGRCPRRACADSVHRWVSVLHTLLGAFNVSSIRNGDITIPHQRTMQIPHTLKTARADGGR